MLGLFSTATTIVEGELAVDFGTLASVLSFALAAGLFLSTLLPSGSAAESLKDIANCFEESQLCNAGCVEPVKPTSAGKKAAKEATLAVRFLQRLLGTCMGCQGEVGCWPSPAADAVGKKEPSPDDAAVARVLDALRSPPRSSTAPSTIPGFDFEVHVSGAAAMPAEEWPEDLRQRVQALRDEVRDDMQFKRHSALGFCRDKDLVRFLTARQGNVVAAAKLLRQALHWRSKRMPYWLMSDPSSDIAKLFERHSRSGKIQVRGHDRFGRSIITMDSSVETIKFGPVQSHFLAYCLEAALAECAEGASKVCAVFDLERLAMGQAPMSSIRECLEILQVGYPETLGTAVLWQPPAYFKTLFAVIKHLIDPKTLAKVVVIHGPAEPGSHNDKVMTEIFGDRWRETTGLGLPRYERLESEWFGRVVDGARGYLHVAQWPAIVERDQRRAEMAAKEGRGPPWKALSFEEAIDTASWDGGHETYWQANLCGSASPR